MNGSTDPLDALVRPPEVEARAGAWARISTDDTLCLALNHAVGAHRLDLARQRLDAWQSFLERGQDLRRHWSVAQVLLACAEIAALAHASPSGNDARSVFLRLEALLRPLDRPAAPGTAGAARPEAGRATEAQLPPWAARVREQLDALPWPRRTPGTAAAVPLLSAEGAWDAFSAFAGLPRQVTHASGTRVLLCPPGRHGIVATLHLKALADAGVGRVYPNPRHHAFLHCHDDFLQAMDDAVAWTERVGLWPKDGRPDVRWTLRRQDGRRQTAVTGPSAGLAVALALGQLAVRMQPEAVGLAAALRRLDLAGVAATACLAPDGALAVVGEVFEKLLAAARDRSLPRIHTVIVAAAEDMPRAGLTREPGTAEWVDRTSDFWVVAADSPEDALAKASAPGRWTGVDCALPRRSRRFVVRRALWDHVQRFVETADAGYLVLVAGMGRGKTSFLKEWLYRTIDRGESPVFHLISYDQPGSGSPDQIARCLRQRVQRVYRVRESTPARATEPDRLLDVLQRLSEQVMSGPVPAGDRSRASAPVLYVDAADQAGLGRAQCLIPDVLPKLPEGIRCVITSRSDAGWFRPAPWIRVLAVNDLPDDRENIAAFLGNQARTVSPPLSDELIATIVGQQDEIPVFLTVADCLRRLQDPHERPEAKAELRSDPRRWLTVPETLVERELDRCLRTVAAAGLSDDDFFETLGVLALAREPLGRAQLEELDLWAQGVTDRVLAAAANFFVWRPRLASPYVPYVFEHPGYRRLVTERLTPARRRAVHRRLADGCRAVVGDPSRAGAHRYADRHGAWHEREGGPSSPGP